MKKILLIACLLISKIVSAQNDPVLLIDGDTVSMKSGLSLPYWLKAGQTLNVGTNVKSASVLEFTIDSNQLLFSQVLSVKNMQTVPTGKAWKVEAIACTNTTVNPGDVLTWNGSNWVASAVASSKPTVTTGIISGLTLYSAMGSATVVSDGGYTILSKGICWDTTSSPTINSFHTNEGPGAANFTSVIQNLGLFDSVTIYYRAYATNANGTSYGATFTFTSRRFINVGRAYQGGIIAYILQPGDPGYDANLVHGLIAATSDQSTSIVWWNGSYITTGATATALGTGNANTNTIVSVQGSGNYAAKLCYDLVLGGYSDWYLPSRDELYKLYQNKTAIGGFAAASYWSSSESNNGNAWFQYFVDGTQYYNGKGLTYYVRAVRAF